MSIQKWLCKSNKRQVITLNKLEQEQHELILTERGMPLCWQKVDDKAFAKWQNFLPNQLLFLWQEYGWCDFQNGLIWLVNPKDYTEIVNAWLEGTELEGYDDFYCYARTAFGTMYIYGAKNKIVFRIIAERHQIWIRKTMLKGKRGELSVACDIASALLAENIVYDYENTNKVSLFSQAIEKFGVLQANEMLAFIPFPMIDSDDRSVSAIQKVKILPQLRWLREQKIPRIIKV